MRRNSKSYLNIIPHLASILVRTPTLFTFKITVVLHTMTNKRKRFNSYCRTAAG